MRGKPQEERKRRPFIAYVTSTRLNAAGAIAGDAIGEMQRQLRALPAGADAIDLLIISYGRDPTVTWRIVSLIRERVPRFSVLVPEAAFSAATLVALGADEIVMHPHGNLGAVLRRCERRTDRLSARSAHRMMSLGERLLRLHMGEEEGSQKAHAPSNRGTLPALHSSQILGALASFGARFPSSPSVLDPSENEI